MNPVMAYPFAGTGIDGVFARKNTSECYETALRNILMTRKGTVPWNPSYGSALQEFVFDLNDEIGRQLILYYAFQDIQRQEPRLRVVGLDADFDADNYQVSFTLAFVESTDSSETVRTCRISAVDVKRIS